MNTWTKIVTIYIAVSLLACERASSDAMDATQPPDAPVEETPDTGPVPQPGAATPLDPDRRIDCELDDGYEAYVNGEGQVVSRARYTYAFAGTTMPTATPWLCLDGRLPSDCRESAACDDAPGVQHTKCSQASWILGEDGSYYVACSYQTEVDPDGDGIFQVVDMAVPAHVALIEP